MILYVFNLADMVTTLIALFFGLQEANPIARFLIGIHPVLFVAVKTVPMYYLCRWLEKQAVKSRVTAVLYWFTVFAHVAVVAWNIVNTVIFTMQ